MATEVNTDVAEHKPKRGIQWFLSLRAIWKLSILELAVYLIIGIVAVIRFGING